MLLRVARGDVTALEAVYDRYYGLVFGIAARILQNVDAAEDATHAVFLTIWRRPLAFRAGSFDAWLARVTRSCCLDDLRRRRPETSIPADLEVDESLESHTTASLDAEFVRAALSCLPESERIPIEMGFFDGITHAEIAAVLHLPVETVTARIRSGLQHLQEYLEQRTVTASGTRDDER